MSSSAVDVNSQEADNARKPIMSTTESPVDYPSTDSVESPVQYPSSDGLPSAASQYRDPQSAGSGGPSSGDMNDDLSSSLGISSPLLSQENQQSQRRKRRRQLQRHDIANRMRRVNPADQNLLVREEDTRQLQRHDIANRMRRVNPADQNLLVREEDEKMETDGTAGESTTIWGTNIAVHEAQRKIRSFLWTYTEDGAAVPKYPQLLADLVTTETANLNLDMQNVYAFDPTLYQRIVDYPGDMIPMIDFEVDNMFRDRHPQEHANASSQIEELANASSQIEVKTFNLQQKKKMREVDPDDIDRLVSFDAMVVRASPIIPDLSSAFFRCVRCRQEKEEPIDRGHINEPGICPNPHCRGRGTMELIHNRCEFLDKQNVRIQETPDNMPEGETPQTIDCFAYKDLVDIAKPGDRVTVTGIYRARMVRVIPRSRVVRSVFKGSIDAIHFQKNASNRFSAENPLAKPTEEAFTAFNEVDATTQEVQDRTKDLMELSRDPDVYEKLVESLAPSIFENEDVKKGLLVQLFGGCTRKSFNLSRRDDPNAMDDEVPADADDDADGAVKFRGEINVLLCGDPGTSKSQLLQYVHKIAPRGVYTSGKGSSAVGLTAYITRDPETREMVLESGALVLSDRGVCCIDEFDKMSDSARAILHEVMEQQTISIAKAGIICSLNARTSILAAANPKDSRYDPNMSVVENILLPPTLISRFDLIYLVLDKPHTESDRRLAQHLVSLYYLERDRPSRDDLIPIEVLTRYISYARENINPKLSAESGEKLIETYMELRNQGRIGGHKKMITATPRQLESLIRMSEALARMRYSEVVEVKDVEEAKRLMTVSTHATAMDPKTGRINMDLLTVGSAKYNAGEMDQQADAMNELMKEREEGRAERGVSKRELHKHYVDDLRREFNRASNKSLARDQFDRLFDFMEAQEFLQIRNRDAARPFVIRLDTAIQS